MQTSAYNIWHQTKYWLKQMLKKGDVFCQNVFYLQCMQNAQKLSVKFGFIYHHALLHLVYFTFSFCLVCRVQISSAPIPPRCAVWWYLLLCCCYLHSALHTTTRLMCAMHCSDIFICIMHFWIVCFCSFFSQTRNLFMLS